MKKAFLPLAALAFALASCDVHDSTQSIGYPEYNLIIDTQDPDQLAQASYAEYEAKYNFTKNVVDIKGNDIVINNQKYSFETDTMALRTKPFIVEGGSSYYLCFSKNGQTAIGSSAKDLNGTVVFCYVPNTNLLNPYYTVTASERLDLSYTLNDRYKVQTFWPVAMFRGQTTSSADGQSFTTKNSDYVASIDFQKNKASVYVYNAQLSNEQSKSFPKVICFDEIPVKYTHEGFSLESSAPKTMILGAKDNKTALVDSVGFAATDFSLYLTSQDLTETIISYKLDGHDVNFRGCSIVKSGY